MFSIASSLSLLSSMSSSSSSETIISIESKLSIPSSENLVPELIWSSVSVTSWSLNANSFNTFSVLLIIPSCINTLCTDIIYQEFSVDRRAIANKRIKYPLFDCMGSLSGASIALFRDCFHNASSTMSETSALRERSGMYKEVDSYMPDGYDQRDIQTAPGIINPVETDYSYIDERFLRIKPAVEQLCELLRGPVYRLRYAIMEPDETLPWHIDQPALDRFVLVLNGRQQFEIKKRKEIHSETQRPGELWYVNTNWEHQVVNSNEKRLALLGCFRYNN